MQDYHRVETKEECKKLKASKDMYYTARFFIPVLLFMLFKLNLAMFNSQDNK